MRCDVESCPDGDGEHGAGSVTLLRRRRRLPGLPGATLAVVAVLGCGSGHKSPADTDPPPDAPRSVDAAPDTPPDATPGFSDATRAEFHLVPDGRLSDGRTRVLYAPKVAWLERFGSSPQLTKAEASGALILNGRFSLTTPTPGAAELAREATAANVALVRADVGMAHVTCGSTAVLSSLLLGDCNRAPTMESLPGGVAFSANANAAAGPEATARITAHLADGSAWDNVLAGDIAWHTSAGDVLHTKLAVDCIGDFGTTGNAIVADTTTCKARYQP